MKIKIKKQLNLPQLIEYAWDNDIKNEVFIADKQLTNIEFDDTGDFLIYGNGNRKTVKFSIEVEEEIDEYTVFHTLVKVIEDGTVYTCTDATINREKNSAVVEIHAILNGVLKLIWTHEKGLVE